MSRFEAHGPAHSLAYGVDHMPFIGTFLQVWGNTEYDMPDGDNIVVDKHQVSVAHIIDAAQRYDIPLDLEKLHRNLGTTPDIERLREFGLLR